MPMTITFRGSRVRLLPLLAVLAMAASLVPIGKAMGATPNPLFVVKGVASEVGEISSSLDKKLHKVDDWIDHMKDGAQVWNDHHDDIKEQLQFLTPGAGAGNYPPAGAVGYVVDTGNQKFSVSRIDIDSPVTRTGMCDVGARAMSCGSLPCRQLYGGRPLPNCATGAELCPYDDPQASHFQVHQGKATLFWGLTPMSVFSLYACSLIGGPSTGGAVLGLGRTGTLARTFRSFSYVLSDRQADAVWLGGARAQQGRGGIPTPLIANCWVLSNKLMKGHGV